MFLFLLILILLMSHRGTTSNLYTQGSFVHVALQLWKSHDTLKFEHSLRNYSTICSQRCHSVGIKHSRAGYFTGIDKAAHEKYQSLLERTIPLTHLTMAQLQIVRDWKMTRNIWRPNWALTNTNTEEGVRSITSLAFQSLSRNDGLSERGIERSIAILTRLVGVGPATACAILSLNTSSVAFFGEEAIDAANLRNVFCRRYDLTSVLKFNREMQRRARQLGARSTGGRWTARDVENALFSAEHGGLADFADLALSFSSSSSSSSSIIDASRFLDGVHFVFTACCNSKQRDILKERMCAAGGIREYDQPINKTQQKGRKRLIAPSSLMRTTTHIIVSERLSENRKTSKSTLAEYLGYSVSDLKNVWVVTSCWATECLRTKTRLEEQIYLVRDDVVPDSYLKQASSSTTDVAAAASAALSIVLKKNTNKRQATLHAVEDQHLSSLLNGVRMATFAIPDDGPDNDNDAERQTLQDPLLRPSTRYLNTTMSIQNSSSTTSSSNDQQPKVEGWMRRLKDQMLGKSVRVGQWMESPTLFKRGTEIYKLYGSENSLDSWQSSLDRSQRCFVPTSSSSSSSSSSVNEYNIVKMRTPFITFVFSRGRWNDAGIVWSAQHVFGESLGRVNHGISTPTVVIVVTPEELGQYRGMLSAQNSLILTIPKMGRAVGYARWSVQKLCSQILRIPFYWSCDDNVAVILRMVSIVGGGEKTYEDNEIISTTPGFLEAFMSAQNIPNVQSYGLIGLLRDRGTAKKCRYDVKTNVLSIYKCLLVNAAGLEREGIEYNKTLTKWEDVSLNYRILEKRSLKTLKIGSFAYWAFNSSSGGCSDQRSGSSRVVRSLEDVVEEGCADSMEDWERIDALRLVEWARLVPGRRTEEKKTATAAVAVAATTGDDGKGRKNMQQPNSLGTFIEKEGDGQPEPIFLQAEEITRMEVHVDAEEEE